jgi:O-acetyl-ADP-ribose deacetylase (regulator of RNase III)
MIYYLIGDATHPIRLPAYIIHVCNDLGGWGAGFVLAITKTLGPNPESSYRLWAQSKEDFRLGQIQIVPVSQDISVVNMIAQTGYISEKNKHPLNIKALRMCLKKVYDAVKGEKITVHMPRIGCGLAGGTWAEVEPIIKATITVDTYVYDLPNQTDPSVNYLVP